MCIRCETREKARQSLAFSRVTISPDVPRWVCPVICYKQSIGSDLVYFDLRRLRNSAWKKWYNVPAANPPQWHWPSGFRNKWHLINSSSRWWCLYNVKTITSCCWFFFNSKLYLINKYTLYHFFHALWISCVKCVCRIHISVAQNIGYFTLFIFGDCRIVIDWCNIFVSRNLHYTTRWPIVQFFLVFSDTSTVYLNVLWRDVTHSKLQCVHATCSQPASVTLTFRLSK
jgi:hypothetical protein